MVHTWNPSQGELLWLWVQLGLHGDFQVRLDYSVKDSGSRKHKLIPNQTIFDFWLHEEKQSHFSSHRKNSRRSEALGAYRHAAVEFGLFNLTLTFLGVSDVVFLGQCSLGWSSDSFWPLLEFVPLIFTSCFNSLAVRGLCDILVLQKKTKNKDNWEWGK